MPKHTATAYFGTVVDDVLVSFAPGDAIPDEVAARIGAHVGGALKAETDAPAPKPEKAEAPDGYNAAKAEAMNVGELLEYVGDNKNHAAAALADENASDAPRKTVLAGLNKVLAA